MVAVPASGFTSPSRIRKVVVFPAPLGPRKPVTVPPSTPKLRSSTARTEPKRLVSPRTSITAIVDPSVPAPRALRLALGSPAVPARQHHPGQRARGEHHQRHHRHPHPVVSHRSLPPLFGRRPVRCRRHLAAARKAAAAAGTSSRPAAANAINVRRSWPQSLPVLINRCPVSIT